MPKAVVAMATSALAFAWYGQGPSESRKLYFLFFSRKAFSSSLDN
jgi:hypothetical protein